MSGALDSSWLTLLAARRYNASKNGLIVEDRWNGDGRCSRQNTPNEEMLSGKLTAIARCSELKLRCLQNELAEAGASTGAVHGGLYAYGPPVWESYQSLTKVPKIFKTLSKHDADDDWSPNACFQGSHRSAADMVKSTSMGECSSTIDDIAPADQPNCTFCTFCKTPEEHWEHFRHKHRSVINSAEVSMAAQRAASARSVYNRWSRSNSASLRPKPAEKDDDAANQRNGGRYKVLVRSGKLGTSMKARLQLVGNNDKSTFCDLRRGPSAKPFHFFSETTEIFFLPFQDLGEIQSCYLQIEGSPGQKWFLEEIMVIDLTSQKAWTFNVHSVLVMSDQNCMITYEIQPKRQKIDSGYEVTVVTGQVNFAGTDAGVSLVLFGRKGASERISLRNPISGGKPFNRGQTDTFRISTRDPGELTRIRIEHDNRGAAPGWFLDRVEIRELESGRNSSWVFPCNQWIAVDEGDGLLYRDLHALPSGSSPAKSIARSSSTKQSNNINDAYEITVVTGDVNFAGTDASVSIILNGENGTSEKLFLRHPVSGRDPFERGQTDVFHVRSKDIGELSKIRIEQNNRGIGAGWFLDQVEVREMSSGRHGSWVFPCNQWLAENEGDGKLYRDLKALPRTQPGTSSSKRHHQDFEISVHTGDVNFAGTDANVSIVLYGTKSTSENFLLNQSISGGHLFERGNTDVFRYSPTKDLGDLTKIRIMHDNRGRAAGWFLDRVEIRESTTQRTWTFACNQWLAENEGDGKLYKELPAKLIGSGGPSAVSRPNNNNNNNNKPRSHHPPKPRVSLSIYELTIETGSSSFTGNNVNIFVQLFGSTGRSNEIWFDVRKSGEFDRGSRDKLCLETTNVGSLKELRIGHDHIGYGSGWLLEKIVLRKYFTKEEATEFRMAIRRRLSMSHKASYEYNDIEMAMFEDEDDSKGFRDPDEYQEFKQKRLEMAAARIPVYEEYRFVCGQWLAVDDDGSGCKTEATLCPTSSVIMFKDLSDRALAEEKQQFEVTARSEPHRHHDRSMPSRKPRKASLPSKNATGPELTQSNSTVRIVEQVSMDKASRPGSKIGRRPRSAANPEGRSTYDFGDGNRPPRRSVRPGEGSKNRLASGRKAVLYSDEEMDDDQLEEHYGMSMSSGRVASAVGSARSSLSIHAKARTPVYTVYKGREIRRFPVPDEKVPWNVEFREYNPTDWTSPEMMGNWVDPDICVERNCRLKFNSNDGKVNRRSHMGEYRLADAREHGVPLNPMGRTGMRGRGKLGRWGPNHAGDPIVTRWKRSERGIVQVHPTTRKPILQFVSIQRRDTGEWAIPGGMVDAGEQVASTLKREFVEEALASLGNLDERAKHSVRRLVDQFFQAENAREIYRGYVDDPRNTDNAWMETVAVSYHDEPGTAIGKLQLRSGDDAAAVRWTDIGRDVKLYASHSSFLQRVARHFNAHW